MKTKGTKWASEKRLRPSFTKIGLNTRALQLAKINQSVATVSDPPKDEDPHAEFR